MRLYMHHKIVTYLDYGDFLENAHGIAWSITGKAQDATGFERFDGSFEAAVCAKRALVGDDAPPEFELLIGESFSLRCEMNPHGLI